MSDDEFYELAVDGAEIAIDVDARTIRVDKKEFQFTLSELEIGLWQQGGMSPAFKTWGKGLLERMTSTKKSSAKHDAMEMSNPAGEALNW
jgi:hypothetical protein